MTTSRPARPATSSIDGHSIWRVTPSIERHRRAGLLQVEQVREVDRRELPRRLERLGDRGQRAGAGEPAVDPTGERDEHHGVAQRGPLFDIEHAPTVGEVVTLLRVAARFG